MESLFVISVIRFLNCVYCLMFLKEQNVLDEVQKSSNANCNMSFSEPFRIKHCYVWNTYLKMWEIK
jgi:hypothetical protein